MRILSLDIGGTKLKYGVFEAEEGKRISEPIYIREIDSRAKAGAEELLKVVFGLCDGEKFDIIAVSTAGMVAEDGSICYANKNIPNYTGVKLRQILEDRYGVKVFVLNDIAAGAIAETTDENKNFYYLSLGTGVGGVMVENGVPKIGTHGIAGQIGYLKSLKNNGIIDCKASVSALNFLGEKDAKTLFEEAERGSETSREIIAAWADEVMNVISLIVGFYDPEIIVIGGGVSRQKEKLIEYLNAEKEILPFPYRDKFELKTAAMSGNSGVYGVAEYARKSYCGH